MTKHGDIYTASTAIVILDKIPETMVSHPVAGPVVVYKSIRLRFVFRLQ